MCFDGCFCTRILRASALDQDQEVSLGVLASNHNRIDLHEKASDIGVFSFNFNEGIVKGCSNIVNQKEPPDKNLNLIFN